MHEQRCEKNIVTVYFKQFTKCKVGKPKRNGNVIHLLCYDPWLSNQHPFWEAHQESENLVGIFDMCPTQNAQKTTGGAAVGRGNKAEDLKKKTKPFNL